MRSGLGGGDRPGTPGKVLLPSADPGGGLSSRENFWKPRYGQCLMPFLAVLQGAHGVWQASPGHPLPSRAWRLWATPTPCPPPHHHHMDILWARHQVGCGLGSLERRSPGPLGSTPPGLQASRPRRQPAPAQPSPALESISETSRRAAENCPVDSLPNTGIREPAEREIRNKCGGGLDRNSAAALARGPRGPWASR